MQPKNGGLFFRKILSILASVKNALHHLGGRPMEEFGKMRKNKRRIPIWLLLAASLLIGACSAPQSAPAEPTETETAAATAATAAET